MNEMKIKRTTERASEINAWFFAEINKIDKLLVKLNKRKKNVMAKVKCCGSPSGCSGQWVLRL